MGSGFYGPGIYQLSPSNGDDKALNIWGGGKEQGAELKLFPREPVTANAQFEIVAAGGPRGQPFVGEPEYHIIASHSGLYLTWPGAQDKTITQELRPPSDPAVRFHIHATSKGGIQINSTDEKQQLNVAGGYPDTGARVISWGNGGDEGPNTVFYLHRVKPN